MARSHVCITCGHDLARVHAPPDPHYRLPVVVCPGCAIACVRRPYGGAARRRSVVRVWRVVAHLFIRLVLLGLFSTAFTFISVGIAVGLESVLGSDPVIALIRLDPAPQARLADWLRTEGSWLLPVWLVTSVCMGVAFGCAFPHWRLRWWPIGVAVALLTFLFAPLLIDAPVQWAHGTDRFTDAWRSNLPPWRRFGWFLWPFATGLAIARATMPTGQRIGRDLHTRKGLRSWRLKKARKRRSQG